MINVQAAVRRLYDEVGISEPSELPLEVVIGSRNILIRHTAIEGAEGRILMRGDSAVLTINSSVINPKRKRFILAHELGHFELHRKDKILFNDTEETLDSWYKNIFGNAELEANSFAAEYLMPSALFNKSCRDMCRDKRAILNDGIDLPGMLDKLALRFDVSLTAAMLRFVECGNHPVMLIWCKNNAVSSYKPSSDFPAYRFSFTTKLPPRPESVAAEVFKMKTSYSGIERRQWVPKSAWFATTARDNDDTFFEYCIYSQRYNYTVSMIWEK